MIIFDIETGPLPKEVVLAATSPFTPPAHPGEFDPAAVKTGNLKDPAKIRMKIDEAAALHQQAVEGHDSLIESARRSWAEKAMSEAALSPLTGTVLAIGYYSTDTGREALDIDEEPKVLQRFWLQYGKCRRENRKLVGHNILGFDLPFLVRRSWVLLVDVPDGVISGGRFDSQTFVDTMSVWSCGKREMISLDTLNKAFGGAGKPEGMDGSMFADLLRLDEELAKQYLSNDLSITCTVAERMGLV